MPETNLIKIVRSIVSRKTLEDGEIMILNLLVHAPKRIASLVHAGKRHLIDHESDNDTSDEILQQSDFGVKKKKPKQPYKVERVRNHPDIRFVSTKPKTNIPGIESARSTKPVKPTNQEWYELSRRALPKDGPVEAEKKKRAIK